MDKNNIKKNNSYNVIAVNAVSVKLKISKQYVRQCVRGDRKGISADNIKKEYNNLVKKIDQLLL
ncbi:MULTISPECIES: hypothetical protein [Flavobacterium]|uniref:XRE family transcriptional regulator n=1 Tax=Flavobacterium keumense TaxID=1306518 RepID=A0ABY8N550_9FLAO|nr:MULTISPECIES: hypothetical protein [Flavobacterium]WGK94760.1 hypothetical protein MG292_00605 [Flavobacterium keumense]